MMYLCTEFACTHTSGTVLDTIRGKGHRVSITARPFWEDIMQEHLRHHLNPLHIYCRLVQSGLEHDTATRICRLYERLYGLIL